MNIIFYWDVIKLRKIKCDVVVAGGARWLDGIKKSKIFDMPKTEGF